MGRSNRALPEHRNRIAAVLLDVHMPVQDGPATLDILRSLDPHIPVCVMSGTTDKDEADQLLRRGARQFVAKPFRFEEIEQIMVALANEYMGKLQEV